MKNIRSTHDKIREILQSNGCEEFGDCIIDEICKAFNFPTTTSVEYFTELAFDSNVSFSQFQREVAEVEFGNFNQIKNLRLDSKTLDFEQLNTKISLLNALIN